MGKRSVAESISQFVSTIAVLTKNLIKVNAE